MCRVYDSGIGVLMIRSAPPLIFPISPTISSHSRCIMCGIPAFSALRSSLLASAFMTMGRLWLAPGRFTTRVASSSPMIRIK